MNKSIWTPFLILALLFANYSFSQSSRGDRILAWQVDLPESGNYDTAFYSAQQACMESIHLFFKWNDLQPDTGAFDQTFIASYLDIINIYYPVSGTSVELQMAVTNTVVKEAPSELQSLPFDHPAVIRNFKKALDTLFSHIPFVTLTSLNIGNESDILFGTNAQLYSEFNNFLDSITPYAKAWYNALHGQNLKVGTTFTHTGLTDPARSALCASVNVNRDIISTTYYPLAPNFTMRPADEVGHDFSELVKLYPDTSQPIYFVECGYASSPVCNSSPQQQADFFHHVFNTWDSLQDNIRYLTLFKTHDWSQATVDTLGLYYGITDSVFLEYLRTLGVFTYQGDGTPKPAYNTIMCELDQRNWCPSANCVLALEETLDRSWKIYPNPAQGMLNIDYGQQKEFSIHLIDATGKTQRIIPPGVQSILTEDLDAGIYFLIPKSQGLEVKKVLIR